MSFKNYIKIYCKELRMNKQLKFHFNPFKEGLNQVLGALEKDIMEVLWNRGESSVKEILGAFSSGRDISYSTVITVTNRMVKKERLERPIFINPHTIENNFMNLYQRRLWRESPNFLFNRQWCILLIIWHR